MPGLEVPKPLLFLIVGWLALLYVRDSAGEAKVRGPGFDHHHRGLYIAEQA